MPITNYPKNVVIDKQKGLVRKVYDYRNNSQWCSRRQTDYTQQYLNVTVILETTDLCILEYQYIQGTHIPTVVSHFTTLIQVLYNLHSDNIVFADLRLSNIIFQQDGNSVLIDYDWSGIHNKTKYPSGFNRNMDDGKRHPYAKPHYVVRKQHDIYTLIELMKLYKPECDEQHCWESALKYLYSYELTVAIEVLGPLYSVRLIAV